MRKDPSVVPRVVDRRRWEALRERLLSSLTARFHLRVHMTFILALSWFSGVAAAWGMKRLGMTDISLRYALAVLAAYMVFVLWVHYLRNSRSHEFLRIAGKSADEYTDIILIHQREK